MTTCLFEDTVLSGVLESVVNYNTLYIFPIENILKP